MALSYKFFASWKAANTIQNSALDVRRDYTCFQIEVVVFLQM